MNREFRLRSPNNVIKITQDPKNHLHWSGKVKTFTTHHTPPYILLSSVYLHVNCLNIISTNMACFTIYSSLPGIHGTIADVTWMEKMIKVTYQRSQYTSLNVLWNLTLLTYIIKPPWQNHTGANNKYFVLQKIFYCLMLEDGHT